MSEQKKALAQFGQYFLFNARHPSPLVIKKTGEVHELSRIGPIIGFMKGEIDISLREDTDAYNIDSGNYVHFQIPILLDAIL